VILVPSGNVPVEVSDLVFAPLGAPAAGLALSASTSQAPTGLILSSTTGVARTPAISAWPDAWLMSGRVVPVGGVITSRIQLGRLSGPLTSRPILGGTQNGSSDGTGSATALAQPTNGGRTLADAQTSTARGFGFGSPIGRFAVTRNGVLLGGSDDGTASVRLVLPFGLVGLAALIGVVAVLAQRRAEVRRRIVE
jgi:hypothetical protein